MRTLIMVMGAALISLLLACDDLAQVQDESGSAATPMSPATPEKPRVDEESSARPNTPTASPDSCTGEHADFGNDSSCRAAVVHTTANGHKISRTNHNSSLPGRSAG